MHGSIVMGIEEVCWAQAKTREYGGGRGALLVEMRVLRAREREPSAETNGSISISPPATSGGQDAAAVGAAGAVAGPARLHLVRLIRIIIVALVGQLPKQLPND